VFGRRGKGPMLDTHQEALGERRVQNKSHQRSRVIVFWAVVVTAVLYVIPYGHYVGYPLLLLSTYVHEMGHGLATEMVGGTFDSFYMHTDGSGLTRSFGTFGRLGSALISAGGLVGPAIMGALFFFLSARPRLARWTLLAFGAGMILSCLWVVNGLFGWLFVGCVGIICVWVAIRATEHVSQAVVAFLATQLAMSVFSRGDYLFTEQARTSSGQSFNPSDVAQMAEALFLPYWFWGSLCGLFSVAILVLGLKAFWAATAPKMMKDILVS
jgi:hypothetical protein